MCQFADDLVSEFLCVEVFCLETRQAGHGKWNYFSPRTVKYLKYLLSTDSLDSSLDPEGQKELMEICQKHLLTE